jgi:catechol 2,3-dioxygenase-like lactoylglutathione lyase family enzyme
MLGKFRVVASLPCVDLDGARNFYIGVLGLKEEKPQGSEDSSDLGALYECGSGTNLFVYQRETPTTADHTAAGWVVDDVDAVVEDLLAKGVTLEVYDTPGMEFDSRGVATMGGFKAAWFKDPEGNILSVSDFQ